MLLHHKVGTKSSATVCAWIGNQVEFSTHTTTAEADLGLCNTYFARLLSVYTGSFASFVDLGTTGWHSVHCCYDWEEWAGRVMVVYIS